MFPVKQFVHPARVYKLEYPAHWDQVQKDEGRSCGFGPHERDDVGLWISIMPYSLDTDRLVQDLPKMIGGAMAKAEAGEWQRDMSLHDYGLKAAIRKEDEGGHYWVIAGGDVVLFASSQVPAAERDVWNPPFEKLMASLRITRDDELLNRKVAGEIMEQLRKLHPDQEFEFDDKGIRGKNQHVYLGNVFREVQAAPERRKQIVKNFIAGLKQSSAANLGSETWEEVQSCILPMLKPRDYIRDEGPTRHLLTQEWLGDVLICYVIKSKKFFRFVTGWDVNRWGTTAEALHQLAIENLRGLPFPEDLPKIRPPHDGRVIELCTGDSLASSRLLHPDLHRVLSGPLGSPFWAGIPDRDTLVTYSDRRSLKQKMRRKLKKDHDSSGYPITPRPFLVTADGLAPDTEK